MSSPSTPEVTNNTSTSTTVGRVSRYEAQKRRDWHTFGQYLRNHRPPLELSRCSGAHVLEFLRYLDQFGKTKIHTIGCPFFGQPNPPAPCPCPLKQAWGSLDALVGRLRAAYEENGGFPETNPFGARAVRLYLREVRDTQGKARGVSYEKKKKKKKRPAPMVDVVPEVAQQAVVVNSQGLVVHGMQGGELNLSDVGYGIQFNEHFTTRASPSGMPGVSSEVGGEDGGIATLPVLHCAYI